jgi:hypothetical protein
VLKDWNVFEGENCITLGLAVTSIYCFVVFETAMFRTMSVETLVLSSLLSERGGRRIVYNMSHEHSNPLQSNHCLEKLHIRESEGKTNLPSQKCGELYYVTLRSLEIESLSTLRKTGDAPSGAILLSRHHLLSLPNPLIPTYKVKTSTMFYKRKLCK